MRVSGVIYSKSGFCLPALFFSILFPMTLLIVEAWGVPQVTNPSFEGSLGSEWTLWRGTGSNTDNNERQYEGGNAWNGVWVLAVKGIGTGGKGAYQYIQNGWQDGNNYRLSFRVRNLSNTQMIYSIGYKLGNGGSDGASATYGTAIVRPSSWTQATVEFTYTGSSGATIYLRVVNDGQSERAGFDLVEITDLGPSGPTSTPTNTVPVPPTSTPTPTYTPGGFTYPGFTWNQLLDHFAYYHERSECIYDGNGTWAALETNLLHPLYRDSSRRALGYMKAAEVTEDTLYDQRAIAALNYLVSEQHSSGYFIWWNTPQGTYNEFDCQYVTGTAGAALADGYLRYGTPAYLQASAKAAQWLANAPIGWNTNYVLFSVWQLAKHYGITGEQQWLDAAIYKVQNCAFPRQDTDGGWSEGSGAPTEMIGHNKRIWYHGIILRGLIELYRVLPENHSIRNQLQNSIQAGINRAFSMQTPGGMIAVGAGVPNEHRNAFILDALLMAYQYVGIDTRDCVRGVMQYRMDFSQAPYQIEAFNIDIQAIGRLMEVYNAIVPQPPSEPTPTPLPPSPAIQNANFEANGGFFTLAQGWLTYGYGKREGFQESGHGWVQGIADYPEGKYAGIYQFIGGVQPGTTYQFSVEARSTSSQLAASIGVSPVENHNRHLATFSSEYNGSGWTTLSVQVTASEPTLTLFLQGRNTNQWQISFERVLFDNASFTIIGGGPTSTFTPTRTPTRTSTRTPTNTPTQTGVNTATNTPTNTPGDAFRIEVGFDSMPGWNSSFDASWGSAASWSIQSGGQSGNFLQASRTSGGSSAKVLVCGVPQNKDLTVSIYMRCPSMSSYWMETAFRLGSYSAQDFDSNSGAWTLIQKFDSYGGNPNGNGNTWTYYADEVNTGSNTQISIGFKLGSSGTGTSNVGWDTLTVEESGSYGFIWEPIRVGFGNASPNRER